MNFKIITRSGKGRFLNFSAKEDIQKDGEKVSEKNGERVSEKASERENESVVKEVKKSANKKETTSVSKEDVVYEAAEKEVATNDAEASAPLSDLLSEGNIDKRILRAMKEMGFEKLSPIQEQAIPYLLEGNDIIGQAQTGTGKTAAFGVPLIQKIDPNQRTLQAIVLCPTRELAIQAAEEIRKLAKFLHGIKVLPIYGGQDINRQIMGLKGVQIIVGTPGRVMDHMRRHTIKLDHVGMVVLDEADEMLNMGFREDMETILGQIPAPHQTALFSATMPQPILEIADRFQQDAKMVKVAAKELTIPLVSQKYYRVKSQDKDAACVRLLEYYQPKLCLIFCNTKKKVDEVADMLKKRGFQAEGLHGDLSQHQRDVAMGRFRNGSANILIATDVAARGIDVDDVEAVINYDVPQDIEYYVHRIGRTGRAGRTGRSFTFVSGREIFKIREIEKVCRTTVAEKKLPGADKAFKAKADKYLNHAWELHKDEDMELMKSFLQRKMDEEGCDALDLACVMLRMEIGEKDEEIAVDDFKTRRGSFGEDRRGDGRKNYRGDGRRSFGEGRPNGEKRIASEKKITGEKRIAGERRTYGEKKYSGERRPNGEKRIASEKRNSGDRKFSGERRPSGDRKFSGDRRSNYSGKHNARTKSAK